MKDSWNPRQYQQFQNERAQPFFDLMALVSPVPKMKIADLGCGTGELTRELHLRLKAAETRGFDNSEAMLKIAQTHSEPGLEFSKETIEKFCEESSGTKYDLIFSNAAIQWVDNHEKIFGALAARLGRGGQVAVQMPANHDYATHVIAEKLGREEPYRSALRDKGGSRQSPVLPVEKYSEMLFALGLKEQKVFMRVYGHVLGGREDVIEWVKGTLLTYYQSRLTEKIFSEFMIEFRKRLFAELKDTKPFFYPFKRILLWGRQG